MFLFTFKKNRRAALFALVSVLLTGLLVISCSGVDDITITTNVNAKAPSINVQPQGGAWNVANDTTHTLTVTANSTDGGTLSYQWYKNTANSTDGGAVVGTDNAALTLEKAHYTGDGDLYFYVVVTNTNNAATGTKTAAVTSSVAKVTVSGNGVGMINAKAPNITVPPQGGTWDVDDDKFTITVTANSADGGTLSYQWYKNTTNSTTDGAAIGTDNKTITLSKNGYEVGDILYFYVVITNTITDNDDGGVKTATATSAVAAVTVTEVSVTNDPIISELIGEWYEDTYGTTYTITSTTFSTGSEYGGYAGTIVNYRSDGPDAGYITIQYTSNDYTPDAVGTYYVIHYENLTASTMDISGAYDADDYDENGFIGKTTQKAAERAYTTGNGCFDWHDTVTKVIDNSLVNAEQPSISAQPTGGSWDVSSANSFNLTVTASVTDGGELSFQWYKNTSNSTSGGTPIGTTNPLSLAKEDYTTNGAYYFYVVVTNTITDNGDGGQKTASATSSIATVTVSGNYVPPVNAAAPSISAQPTGGFWNVWLTSANATFSRNTAKLTVTANSSDGGNLSYQWYVNSANSTSSSTLLTGKTSAALSLTAQELLAYPDIENGTNYFYVVVTNTITDNGDGGTKTAAATSAIINVTLDGVATHMMGVWYANNYQPDYRTVTDELVFFSGAGTGMRGDIQYISFFDDPSVSKYPDFGIMIVKYQPGHKTYWWATDGYSDEGYDYFGIYIEQYDPDGSKYNYQPYYGFTGKGSIGWTSTSDGNNSYGPTETTTLDGAITRFDKTAENSRWFVSGLTPPYVKGPAGQE